MLRTVCRNATLVLIGIVASATTAHAGVYADDLAKCLVESSSSKDRIDLVKWMFTAMAAHPAVKSLSKVTAEDREAANKAFGEIATRLLTEDCRDKTSKAARYEGAAALQSSFTVLGQVAAEELFENAEVAAVLSGLEKYVDSKKLERLSKPESDEDQDQR